MGLESDMATICSLLQTGEATGGLYLEQMRCREDGSWSTCFAGQLASPVSVAARFPGNCLLELEAGITG